MKLQLFRNATLKLDYAGRIVLIDPYFAPKHSLESFTGRSLNPMVELPVDIEDILDGVELVIVSHLHDDHFDSVAMERVPKHLPLFCQPGDEATIREAGFADVTPLAGRATWEGLTLTRREGSHGLGAVVELMGSVMGFSLEAAGEPSLYWAGDTVLYPPVAEVIRETKPDIIVTHSCGARWDGDLIVMDAEQTIAVCEASQNTIVIATHMEALDHATVSRLDLRKAAQARGIAPSRLLIPHDGETVVLGKS
ncbi:MBL fold metallo-hydrolase [Rhizobium herbae]|uniref:L-ascorbate metabolism protein UlaG (Beta-lactamase superfamily) n=1 Tax=Rhizobium herbae TaxID=508661 RepID=A0ABS4EPK6_9HYPH|nr:MBL fold metallo-hydrolase [Rhizobium herbae]MBP1859879.1 L-ascorbate metabolism protein UlaG (beta-lactamase superfamily) [Rhizobium herbae]